MFWLSDRSMVRDLIGNYDSLPDTYTLADYQQETDGFDVRGIVWSDAGAADPVASAAWVQRQDEEHRRVMGAVRLGDPNSTGFADLVRRWREIPLVRSVRVRLVEDLQPWTHSEQSGACSLGSDLPIERLRSGFGRLYEAYSEIFANHSDAERDMFSHSTAGHWYGADRRSR